MPIPNDIEFIAITTKNGGRWLKNCTATAEERSELVLEEAIADKRAQRVVQLSGKICDLFFLTISHLKVKDYGSMPMPI